MTPTTRPFERRTLTTPSAATGWGCYARLRFERCDTCCCRPVAGNRDGWGAEHCPECPRGDAVRRAAA